MRDCRRRQVTVCSWIYLFKSFFFSFKPAAHTPDTSLYIWDCLTDGPSSLLAKAISFIAAAVMWLCETPTLLLSLTHQERCQQCRVTVSSFAVYIVNTDISTCTEHPGVKKMGTGLEIFGGKVPDKSYISVLYSQAINSDSTSLLSHRHK